MLNSGVHTTQFAIRDVGLYRPVLELAMRTAAEWAKTPPVMIAGLAGRTTQAVSEAQIARDLAALWAAFARRLRRSDGTASRAQSPSAFAECFRAH